MLTFVETKLFTQLVAQNLSHEEYRQLQHAMAANPEAGDVVRGSAVSASCAGASRDAGHVVGVRVVYYLRLRRGQVWILTMYAKNEAATIPGPVLKRIKEEIDGLD